MLTANPEKKRRITKGAAHWGAPLLRLVLQAMAIGEQFGREVGGQVDGTAEEAEDGGTAARHGGIDGSEVVESLLDGCNLGVQDEDALLEVVHQLLAPRLYGLADDVVATFGGLRGGDEREGFLRRHRDVGTDYGDMVARQVEVYGLQPLADAFGVGGSAEDEEGAVGAKAGSIAYHLVVAEPQGEHLVQQADGVGAVAGATPHARLCGYALEEVGVDAWHLLKVLLQQVVGAHDEVALLVALDADIRDLDVAVDGRRELRVHDGEFQCVADGHGVKHGFKVVVSVRTPLYHVQPQVDFCYWKCYHAAKVEKNNEIQATG